MSWSDMKIQEYYGIYYCKKCGCKIDRQQKHPMQCIEMPIPFSVCHPLCEEHAKELIALDLSPEKEYKTKVDTTDCDPEIDDSYTGQIATLKKTLLSLQEDVVTQVEVLRLLTEMGKTDCYLQSCDTGYNSRAWYVTLPDPFEGSDYTVSADQSLLGCLREAELKGWDF